MAIDNTSFQTTLVTPGATAAPPRPSNIQAALDKLGGATNIVTPPAAEPKTDVPPIVAKPEGDPKPEGEPAKTEPKKEDALSQRFAMLARREEGIVKAQQDLKAKEAQIAEQRKSFESQSALEAQRKKEVAENPLKALEYYGVTYQQLTDFILKGEKPTPEMTASKIVDEKLEAWKKQQEEERAAAASKERDILQKQHEQVLQQFRTDVADFVKANADQYELISLYNQAPLVISTIETHFEKTQKILDFKEAADLVEKYLEEEALKAMQTKKLAAKGTPQPQGDAPKGDKQNSPAQPRTLTNTMSSSVPSMLPAKTEAERMERAMAALSR